MDIIKSASKLVFVLMALATIVLTFLHIITGEQFLVLASMAFSFFFSYKSDNKENLPYNGK